MKGGKGGNGILLGPLTALLANTFGASDGGRRASDVGQMVSTIALQEGFCTEVGNFRVAYIVLVHPHIQFRPLDIMDIMDIQT